MVAKFKGRANSDVDGFDVAVSQWDGFAPSCESVHAGMKIAMSS